MRASFRVKTKSTNGLIFLLLERSCEYIINREWGLDRLRCPLIDIFGIDQLTIPFRWVEDE